MRDGGILSVICLLAVFSTNFWPSENFIVGKNYGKAMEVYSGLVERAYAFTNNPANIIRTPSRFAFDRNNLVRLKEDAGDVISGAYWASFTNGIPVTVTGAVPVYVNLSAVAVACGLPASWPDQTPYAGLSSATNGWRYFTNVLAKIVYLYQPAMLMDRAWHTNEYLDTSISVIGSNIASVCGFHCGSAVSETNTFVLQDITWAYHMQFRAETNGASEHGLKIQWTSVESWQAATPWGNASGPQPSCYVYLATGAIYAISLTGSANIASINGATWLAGPSSNEPSFTAISCGVITNTSASEFADLTVCGEELNDGPGNYAACGDSGSFPEYVFESCLTSAQVPTPYVARHNFSIYDFSVSGGFQYK